MSQMGSGIWTVVFNLYLLRSGFSTGFVGLFLMVDMLFHGLVAFPAGLIADRIGRRKAFFFATCLNLVARGSLLFTTDPATLLVLAALAGTGEAFHGSAGPPFIMENSQPEERPLLFSMQTIFHLISRSLGSALPLVWAVTLGVPDLNIGMARWLLVLSLPLTFIALAPLWFMTERRDDLAGSFMDLITLKNVVNFSAIAKLALCNVMVGLGMGLATRFLTSSSTWGSAPPTGNSRRSSPSLPWPGPPPFFSPECWSGVGAPSGALQSPSWLRCPSYC